MKNKFLKYFKNKEYDKLKRDLYIVSTVFVLFTALAVWFAIFTADRKNERLEWSFENKLIEYCANSLKQRLDNGRKHPYSYLEMIYNAPDSRNSYFLFVVSDSTGLIVAPEALKDKSPRIPGTEDFMMLAHEIQGYGLSLYMLLSPNYIYASSNILRRHVIWFLLAFVIIILIFLRLVFFPLAQKILSAKKAAETELVIAQKLQFKAVTNVFPSDDRFDVYGTLKPTRDVGGDLFGCEIVGDYLYFTAGDVSDKGMGAAFVMFMISSISYSMILEMVPLDKLFKNLNTLLCNNFDYDMFCTMFYARINLNTLEMEYVNAGHEKLILNGEFIDQPAEKPLGLFKDYKYTIYKKQLHRGDVIFQYTDGVTEARDVNRNFFGNQRLLATVSSIPAGTSAEKSVNILKGAVDKFSHKTVQADDIAIICIKLK